MDPERQRGISASSDYHKAASRHPAPVRSVGRSVRWSGGFWPLFGCPMGPMDPQARAPFGVRASQAAEEPSEPRWVAPNQSARSPGPGRDLAAQPSGPVRKPRQVPVRPGASEARCSSPTSEPRSVSPRNPSKPAGKAPSKPPGGAVSQPAQAPVSPSKPAGKAASKPGGRPPWRSSKGGHWGQCASRPRSPIAIRVSRPSKAQVGSVSKGGQ